MQFDRRFLWDPGVVAAGAAKQAQVRMFRLRGNPSYPQWFCNLRYSTTPHNAAWNTFPSEICLGVWLVSCTSCETATHPYVLLVENHSYHQVVLQLVLTAWDHIVQAGTHLRSESCLGLWLVSRRSCKSATSPYALPALRNPFCRSAILQFVCTA